METSLAYSNKPWGDMLYDEEQTKKLALLRMPEPEWLACVNAYFARLRGNGRALISALSWAQQVATERAEFQSPRPTMPVEPTEDERNWRVWKDMVEEPEKYGSDIGEWTALDEELRRGPKRWRVDAYWYEIVRTIEAEQKEAAATKLQALWRGHNLRYVMGPRFNCARCLKHELCWVAWEDRTEWLCRDCSTEWSAALRALGEELEREEEHAQWLEDYEAREAEDREQGLEVEVCGDCGDEIVQYAATIGDLLLCAGCIHDWTACDRCNHAFRLGTRCDNHCLECGDEMPEGQPNDFCSGDCHYAYMRDC